MKDIDNALTLDGSVVGLSQPGEDPSSIQVSTTEGK